MKLNNQIYFNRVAKRWSQRYVAEQVGVTASMISLYEKGKNTPSKDVIKKLAELYNVDEQVFLKSLEEVKEYKKLDKMSKKEKEERLRLQQKKARQKYYLKNKKKFHEYYLERKKKNGISGSEKQRDNN